MSLPLPRPFKGLGLGEGRALSKVPRKSVETGDVVQLVPLLGRPPIPEQPP